MQLELQLHEKRQSQLTRDAEFAAKMQAEELTADELIARDRLLAEKIQAKEKMRALRRKLAREKRQVARLSSGQAEASIPAVVDDADADLSDFCMRPPNGLSEEEIRIFQEEQDAELARFLQQQEAARNLVKERLQVIEDQDREIARILQEKEKAKLRRIREKNRERTHRPVSGDRSYGGSSSLNNSDDHCTVSSSSSTLVKSIASTSSPRLNSGRSMDLQHCKDEKNNIVSSVNEDENRTFVDVDASNSSNCNFHNVAMDLDPTYNKKSTVQKGQCKDSTDVNGLHFARLCRVSPHEPVDVDLSTNENSQNIQHQDVDPNSSSAVIPVVPGQKRKGKGKRNKEGCKTQ